MAKRAVLHIGTHKTGTTSFQAMLADDEDGRFAAVGLCYPMAGRVEWGHHGLANELLQPGAADPAGDPLGQLTAELRESDKPAVILSSENFSVLFGRPERLEALRQALAAAAVDVEVIAVLRNPADYLESLYVELLKFDLQEQLDEFVAGALARGVVGLGPREYCLDYTRLLGPFAQVFGPASVHTLAYDPEDAVGPLLSACSPLLRLELPTGSARSRLNARATPADGRRRELTQAERDALLRQFGPAWSDALRTYPMGSPPARRRWWRRVRH